MRGNKAKLKSPSLALLRYNLKFSSLALLRYKSKFENFELGLIAVQIALTNF